MYGVLYRKSGCAQHREHRFDRLQSGVRTELPSEDQRRRMRMSKCPCPERLCDCTQVFSCRTGWLGDVYAGEDVLGHRVQQTVLAVDVVVQTLCIDTELSRH